MSHTVWTEMLAPELLAALESDNGTVGLDDAKAHRCLLRQWQVVLAGKALCCCNARLIQNSVQASPGDPWRDQLSTLSLHTQKPSSTYDGPCTLGHTLLYWKIVRRCNDRINLWRISVLIYWRTNILYLCDTNICYACPVVWVWFHYSRTIKPKLERQNN